MSLSRKHFVAVADILRNYLESLPEVDQIDIIKDFADFFSQENPRFDSWKFSEYVRSEL